MRSVTLLCPCLLLIAASLLVSRTSARYPPEIITNGPMAVDSLGFPTSMSLNQERSSYWYTSKQFRHGIFSVKMKLPQNGNGVAVAFYLESDSGWTRDEIDFELLGYTGDWKKMKIHTNYFHQGVGDYPYDYFFWFDPTADFHTYTIIWDVDKIIWKIDNRAIRILQYKRTMRIPFNLRTLNQPMRLYGSIWNASDWASDCGQSKINVGYAPWTAYVKDLSYYKACIYSRPKPGSCEYTKNYNKQPWKYRITRQDLKYFMFFNRGPYVAYSPQWSYNYKCTVEGPGPLKPMGRRSAKEVY